MRLVLQTANVVSDAKNCLYPNRVEAGNAAELQEAIKKDHVCGEYKKNYRSKENFIRSNVAVMDCDNDHSEDPEEWMTPEKMEELFGDFSYLLDTQVIGSGSVLRTAIIFFYISNEGLSLVENAAYLGLPIPTKLHKVLEQLHDRSEKEDEKDGEE